MQKKKMMSTKNLAYCALLVALSVVLARVFGAMPNEYSRFSIEAVPIFLAGMLFGGLPGLLVGFAADLVGCLFSGYGYNPIFCLPPMIYGFAGGLMSRCIGKRTNLFALISSFFAATVVGSIVIQSFTLAYVYPKFEAYKDNLIYYFSTRSGQFALTAVVDVVIIYLLMKSKIFTRMGLWDIKTGKNKEYKMTVQEAIAYIESVSWKGSVPGLERPAELLRRMGSPEKQLKYIHIGGTNGKGSTAAMTASILKEAGYKVGLYTSPHLYRFNERIQINGVEIADQDLADITAFAKPLAESMEDVPTEFELVWCIAVEYFKRQKCDIVVVEVGMGGELDATNTIGVPEVAVITNVGLDHTGILGNTVEEIAQTKAGIFKEGGSAVIYRSGEAVEAVLEQMCKEKNVTFKKADFDSIKRISHGLDGQVFDCGERTAIELPLLGDHQLYNASVVLSIVDTLIEKGWKITEEHIRAGMKAVYWPGRFDIVSRDPLFIIDGGHNPQCFDALMKNVADYLPGKRIIALTGVLADKDYGEMFKPVMAYVEQFVCITPPNDRKLEAAELAKHLQAAGGKATAAETIEAGVKMAKELAGTDGVVLCFGSLYSIGEIHAAI